MTMENVWRIKDWCISRKRRWGCPIPVGYDEFGNAKASSDFIYVKDRPSKIDKGVTYELETDTLDTFFDSSVYWLYYLKSKYGHMNKRVDLYMGGIEHACLHLLYARAMQKALLKIGYEVPGEPFYEFVANGMVLHKPYWIKNTVPRKYIFPHQRKDHDANELEEGDVCKMSKSKKNSVNIEDLIEKHDPLILKMAVLSDSPITKDSEWCEEKMKGPRKIHAFLKRYEYLLDEDVPEDMVESEFKMIKNIDNLIEHHKYNLAISEIYKAMRLSDAKSFVKQLIRRIKLF